MASLIPDATQFAEGTIEVASPDVTYTEEEIVSKYAYHTTDVAVEEGKDGQTRIKAVPKVSHYEFRTQRVVPKTGLMIVGWGGNNGTTVTAGIMANRLGLSWVTKNGVKTANYVGSVTQASTIKLGNSGASDIYVPLKSLVPMVNPNDFVIGGWDISSMNLGDAMRRAEVLHAGLQAQLYDAMKKLEPLPSIYVPDFIAANQGDRADNVIGGTKSEQVEVIRGNIRDFKAKNGLDKVIVLWSANTERFAEVRVGLNDTSETLLASIAANDAEVAPSSLFAVASIMEGCSYINGSPQNTFVPGVVELACARGVFIGGDDFKSGQTKMKSVLVDFMVSAGIKPVSVASYNHLGNNDGLNLSAPQQFRSKEISKSNVITDMVASNGILYKDGESPDHIVVIKYLPYVKDSKRALDEYTSEIFMNGLNTIVLHNTCEDSLLAAPLIIDLAVLTELFERMRIKPIDAATGAATQSTEDSGKLHSVLSLLSYLLKAPMVAPGTPVINALFRQREAIVNVLRAAIGLSPDNNMQLENRLASTVPKVTPAAAYFAALEATTAHAAGAGAGAGAATATATATAATAKPATKESLDQEEQPVAETKA